MSNGPAHDLFIGSNENTAPDALCITCKLLSSTAIENHMAVAYSAKIEGNSSHVSHVLDFKS